MWLERLHITIFLVLAGLVWWIVLLLQGTPVTLAHVRPFSAVVATLVGLGLLLDLVLWHAKCLQGWLVKRPDLRGTWRVELKSSYTNPETGERVPMIVCYMGVKQTLSKLQMHLMTPESESWFIADNVRSSPSGNGYQVIGVYTNEPNIHLRDARISEMHQGAIILETHGEQARPVTLTAKYWTDRKTTGSMEFTSRVERVYTRFADADRALSTAGEQQQHDRP